MGQAAQIGAWGRRRAENGEENEELEPGGARGDDGDGEVGVEVEVEMEMEMESEGSRTVGGGT